MRQLLSMFKPWRRDAVLAPLFKLLEATFELLVPLVIAQLIDVGIAGGDRGYIFGRSAILVAFGVVGMAAAITAQYFAARAAVGFAAAVRRALFEKINALSFSALDQTGTSTLLTRLTNDVNQVQNGVNLLLRLFLRSPFIVFGAVIMACVVDAGSAPLFLGVVAALSVVVFGVMLLTIRRYKAIQSQLDLVLESTRENLDGARVIRAFCSEADEDARFTARNRLLSRLQTATGRLSALLNPVTFLLINAGVLLLIRYGALQVDSGALTRGQVVALYNYMGQILVELIKLADLIITVTRAAASGVRISDVLRMDTSVDFAADDGVRGTAAVEFRNVSLAYHEGAAPALRDISFTAQPGQVIGIIGGTGSGKTSLVHLLPRFYDATGGEIRILGRDVRSWPLEQLRCSVPVVLQRAVLFQGTLRENLRWGNPEADDDCMWDALTAAQAASFVQEKGGLDMPIAAGGRNLSGGQRQRLSIARALVGHPPVLVLDDSASALDYVTERSLRTAIADLPEHPTVFMVSQRTASLRQADQILVLDGGHLVGCGRHEELLNTCPVYREIYESQFGKGEEAAQ